MMKKTPAKQAVAQLDKALSYKIAALDSSMDKIFKEIGEIAEALVGLTNKVDSLENDIGGIHELADSIAEMKQRRDSYQNVINVKGAKATIEDPNLPKEEPPKNDELSELRNRITVLETKLAESEIDASKLAEERRLAKADYD